jgi:hypothetical protein
MGDAPAAVQRVIHCWSGPRCVSTALMYSFAQRRDVEVVDEPLYAHFLRTHPAAARPYREAVLAAQDGDGAAVVRQLQRGAAQPGRVLFAKHMAKQRLGLGPELLRSGRHFLLVRPAAAALVAARPPARLQQQTLPSPRGDKACTKTCVLVRVGLTRSQTPCPVSFPPFALPFLCAGARA